MELRKFFHKDLGRVEFRTAADGAKSPGTIAAYSSLFMRFSQNLGGFVEQIAPTAFDRVLTPEHETFCLFNHNESRVLGSTLAGTCNLTVDGVGLRYESFLPMAAADVAEFVSRGEIRGSSFSFATATDGDEWSLTPEGFPLRTIVSVARLYDVGPVTYPAYLSTQETGASVAMRSLSHVVGRNADELAEAAAAGRLTEIVTRHLNPGTPEPPAGLTVEHQRARIAAERSRLERNQPNNRKVIA